MSHTITDTNFEFPEQSSLYKGKVREVYNIKDTLLVMVATDRLSAFDVVMPKGIPYKGQIGSYCGYCSQLAYSHSRP